MSKRVYILGGDQSDFAMNWNRQGLALYDLLSQTVLNALDKTHLKASDIETIHIGNFAAELFAGQGNMGGFFPHIDPGFAGIPTSRHEGACASGSLAILAAMAEIEAGRYDLACVAGVEYMRNVSGQKAADYLAPAAWAHVETDSRQYVWPALFSNIAERYDEKYGLKREHLATISKKNFANARRNPRAQARNWSFTDDSFEANNDTNPIVEGWMRRSDCGQVTDGSAVIFLASESKAKEYADANNIPLESLPYIKGWGQTTAPMKLATKFEQAPENDYMFPYIRKAITDAYRRADISGPDMLDGIETHDCFSITEYMAIEHFGITAPGKAWQAIEDEKLTFNGALPMNASGGLIGLGHPVGATGIRMMLDAYKQTRGLAGEMQVEGAKTYATYNVGGSGTTNVSFVVHAAA
ncbi:acetyl-CoA acetyltransferase [Kordiimonas sp. SCSIO 12610]|uniref:acetyl-CoA acetyltransferase n=1 Tax=Kordiimonas sp. SCSIO 12610 TaxID=2829597 RepID=UPI00210A3170|nr:acetyl-CoA acetyltransferase [Kordiimonas sp. SCSIO 12610]UTW53989.1 acetyl-CoA acetyltransferase [Kordiimonas sp. SCSIO 12610]